jgi:hypothetical protein
MGYAINLDQKSLRSVDTADDCLETEYYSEAIPDPWPPAPTPLEALIAEREDIPRQRFEMETSGVEFNGYLLKTDRDSQQLLDSTINAIRRGLVVSVDWKCANGWMVMDATNIDAIEILVLTHIQTAFAWEKATVAAIDAQIEALNG